MSPAGPADGFLCFLLEFVCLLKFPCYQRPSSISKSHTALKWFGVRSVLYGWKMYPNGLVSK